MLVDWFPFAASRPDEALVAGASVRGSGGAPEPKDDGGKDGRLAASILPHKEVDALAGLEGECLKKKKYYIRNLFSRTVCDWVVGR